MFTPLLPCFYNQNRDSKYVDHVTVSVLSLGIRLKPLIRKLMMGDDRQSKTQGLIDTIIHKTQFSSP